MYLLIGGWGDFKSKMEPFYEHLHQHLEPLYYFRYKYSRSWFEWGPFSKMQTLAKRLWQFIQDEQLVSHFQTTGTKLDLICYSQGGLLALFTAGIYPEFCNMINKIIMIAAPHGGIISQEAQKVISDSYDALTYILRNIPLGGFFADSLDFVADQLDVFNIGFRESIFLSTHYPRAVKKVAQSIPKSRILQIYSPQDILAPRAVSERFKSFMHFEEIPEQTHYSILESEDTLQKILKFLDE